MQEYKNFIGGMWQAGRNGVTFENENPARIGVGLGRFQSSAPEDVTLAVDAAQEAFADWKHSDLATRQACVERFLGLLRDQSEELARIVSAENGKTLAEARGEVGSALTEGTYHLRQVSVFSGETLPAGTCGYTGWTEYHPLGVVGIISPWNFPMNVMCRKAIPALLMGNTVIFKPASYTPWSGIFMAGLFEAAGLPKGAFNCVTGTGSKLGNALIDDKRVRAISFTGSTEAGTKIQERAARSLTRTQLELGGKNAMIVMDDADKDEAVDAAITAGFACAGQWCTSTSRILLQKGICKTFLDQLAAHCEQVVVGDPLDERTEMGPVAGPKQFDGICGHMETAKTEGATLLTGGVVAGDLGAQGYYIRPTLFAGVTPEMTLFREEVFGPVLAAVEFKTLDQALTLANDSIYGLSSAIFTRDVKNAQTYIREIEAGVAHVNIHSGFKLPALPFGGWKSSGFGPPENGRTGLEFFVNHKAVYVNG